MNTYDQLRRAIKEGLIPMKKAVAISYSRRSEGRAGWGEVNRTIVWSPLFKTDSLAHWHDNDCKTFVGKRAESFPRALEWASKKYGIEKWRRNGLRAYVPSIVQEKLPI